MIKKFLILILVSLPIFAYSNDKVPTTLLDEARNTAIKAIKEKDFEKALSAYDSISIAYSHNIDVANDIAVILAALGRLDEARNLLEVAISENAEIGNAFLNLREILARQASISYSKALNIKPPDTLLSLKSNNIDLTQERVLATVTKENKNFIENLSVQTEILPKLSTDIPISIIKDEKEIIKNLIYEWAVSWSKKDFQNYIDFYSDDFTNSRFKSKTSWKKYRKPRVIKRGTISVKVKKIKIDIISKYNANISFRQRYVSGSLRLSTTKKMKLKKENDEWKIVSEN